MRTNKQPFVLTRGGKSGVMCGFLVRKTPTEIVLREARQVWRWRGANTLADLSQSGASLMYFTRISDASNLVTLERSDVSATLVCTADATANLRKSRWLP